MELRDKLALAPQKLPEPPPPSPANAKSRLVIRLVGVAAVTSVGVIAYRMGSVPPASLPPIALRSEQPTLAAYPLPPTDSSPAAARALRQKSSDVPLLPARLAVGAAPPRQAGEAAGLTVSVANAGTGASVVISGLAPGASLTTGRQVGPNTWRLAVAELAGAAVTPPRGFVGASDLMIELRRADDTVDDRAGLRLEWLGAAAPAKPPPPKLDASEIALMVKNGAELMANGSIGAARMMFQPAAEAGDPVAAFGLAETYDPLVLKMLNAKGGITPDIAIAQAWYRKARDLGSVAAPERIERLARLPE